MFSEGQDPRTQDAPEIAPANGYGSTFEEARENARLIAAAPDLLAVLKSIVKRWTEKGLRGPVYEEARAAIAKAEGQEGSA